MKVTKVTKRVFDDAPTYPSLRTLVASTNFLTRQLTFHDE